MDNGWSGIMETNFGELYSLTVAFFGLFETSFEILIISAIWGPQKISNWLESDWATSQNAKVYQNPVWQKWWFSKCQKKLNSLKNILDSVKLHWSGCHLKANILNFYMIKYFWIFFIINAGKNLKIIKKLLTSQKMKTYIYKVNIFQKFYLKL